THAHAPSAHVIDRPVPGRDSDIAVRIYTPEGSRDGPLLPLLVLFHGGGFIAGSIDSHDGGARELCAQARAIVVTVDYRLAPEHRLPAAAEDCHAVLLWGAAHAAELGGDSTRLAITGDSAG